jgi:hypothetical protein
MGLIAKLVTELMTLANARWRRFCRQRVGLPLLLAGLSVGTAVTTVRMVLAPAATPWPRWTVPTQLVLPGYEVSAPVDQGAHQTRNFSHGPVRRFVLRAMGEGPSFVLTLVAVRGRELGDLREMVFGRSDASADPRSDASADGSTDLREPLVERRLMRLRLGAAAGAEASEQPARELALGRGPADAAGSTTRWQTCLTASGGAAASDDLLSGLVEKQMAAELWQNPLRKWLAHLAGEPLSGWECLLVQLRSETAGDQKNRLVPLGKEIAPQLLSGSDRDTYRQSN